MKPLRTTLRKHRQKLLTISIVVAATLTLYMYKLGSLAGGLSKQEIITAGRAVGWHGLYHDPFYLPLNLLRSVAFFLRPEHGQTITRFSNVALGLAAAAAFYLIARAWYGMRIGIVASIMFMTSAWVLHVSRYASYDVMYLWVLPTLLVTHVAIRKYTEKPLVVLGCFVAWIMLLYVPGMVWFLAITIFLQRKYLLEAWNELSNRYKIVSFGLLIIGLPLLIFRLFHVTTLLTWLGLPHHLDALPHLGKNFAGVFVHLFIRGPQYPDIWLGRIPILDIFALSMALAGLYFFFSHISAFRSKLLLAYFGLGVVLIALGGPVSISLLVPLLYLYAATGIAYLLHDWLKTFPHNTLARGFGIGLVGVAVALSCVYNLRAYFVAWPHNADTKATFRYHR